jgi:hypothetical protein
MSKSMAGILAGMLASVITVSAVDLSSLSSSKSGWLIPSAKRNVVSIDLDGSAPYASSLVVDARGRSAINITSKPFAVEPLQGYEFSVQIGYIYGEMGFSTHLVWLDENEQFLSEEYILMGVMIPGQWTPLRYRVIAPEQAHSARLVIYMPGGWAARFADFQLNPSDWRNESLSVDLVCSPIRFNNREDAELSLRLENRGSEVIEDLSIELRLPPGLSTAEAASYQVDRLSYQQLFETAIPLIGYPHDSESLIKAEISGIVAGEKRDFSAAIRPFVSVAKEYVVAGEDLPEPVLADLGVKLGAYYFPVMLDWNRAGWGVQPVDYLEPLLGYYDESSTAVADWHIYWALEHGLSYFVFCWYFNQGMEYLNDALDKGFLRSRFGHKMEFALNWCTEDHAAEFKPESFSDEAINDFIEILCEKYFPHENYLKVDGKHVVFLQTPIKLIQRRGGLDGMRKTLEQMREVARGHGFEGVYFVAVHLMPYLIDFSAAGFDCVTAYAYGFRDVNKSFDSRGYTVPYHDLFPRHEEAFATARELAHAQGIDYIPVAWLGWDDYARNRYHSGRTPGNTPGAFRRMLEILPDYVESDTRLALIEAWNEWGEGGHAEPSKRDGFFKLSAIRDALSDQRGPYRMPVPPAVEIATFHTDKTWDDVHSMYNKRFAQRFNFPQKGLQIDFKNGDRGLWLRPAQGVVSNVLTNGQQRFYSINHDPALLSPPMLQMHANDFRGLEIRMKVENGSYGSIFWSSDRIGQFSSEREVFFKLTPDGQFHTYNISLSGHPEWKGFINQFRIDPTDQPGEVVIDFIRTVAAD